MLHLHVFDLDVVGFHSWRQTQTQTVIYNFVFHDNNILHPQRLDLNLGSTDLKYEFPLYQWIIAQFDKVFGYYMLNTRLLSFVFFVSLLLGFYKLLLQFTSNTAALIGNALLCFSPLLHYYCVNPIPDVLALSLSVWALYLHFLYQQEAGIKNYLLFVIFISLATLCKLPFILFGTVVIIPAWKKRKQGEWKQVMLEMIILLIGLFPAALWYIQAAASWKGNPVTGGLLQNDKDLITLLDYAWFTLTSSVPELLTNFAACLLLFAGIYRYSSLKNKGSHITAPLLVPFISFLLFYLYEINLIEKTHDYYLLPFLPFLFLVVTYGANQWIGQGRSKWVLVFVCIAPITAWLRIDHRWNVRSPGYNTDLLEKQELFRQLIPEHEKCIVYYDHSRFISLYFLKRQGYSLEENELDQALLHDLYDKDCRFLLSEDISLDLNKFPDYDLQKIYAGKLLLFKIKRK